MAEAPTTHATDGEAGDILAPMRRLRRRLRAWLAFDGVARVVTLATAAFLVMAALDWWLVFPPFLRAAGAITLGVCVIVYIDRRILRPLLRPIPLGEIAARLDRRRAGDDDRLSSLVDHVEQRADGASPLWQRVETETAGTLDQTLVDAAIVRTPTLRRVSVASAIVLLLIVVRFASPGWLELAWLRT